MQNHLITNKEAAHYLGIAPGTLQNWRWLGKGPRFVQVGPQAVRYRLSDLDSYIKDRQRQEPMRRKGAHRPC